MDSRDIGVISDIWATVLCSFGTRHLETRAPSVHSYAYLPHKHLVNLQTKRLLLRVSLPGLLLVHSFTGLIAQHVIENGRCVASVIPP